MVAALRNISGTGPQLIVFADLTEGAKYLLRVQLGCANLPKGFMLQCRRHSSVSVRDNSQKLPLTANNGDDTQILVPHFGGHLVQRHPTVAAFNWLVHDFANFHVKTSFCAHVQKVTNMLSTILIQVKIRRVLWGFNNY